MYTGLWLLRQNWGYPLPQLGGNGEFIFMRIDLIHNPSIGYLLCYGPGFLLMKKIVFLPVGILVPTPWASPTRSFVKYLVHIFEFGPRRRAGYYSSVPVICLVTSLAL